MAVNHRAVLPILVALVSVISGNSVSKILAEETSDILIADFEAENYGNWQVTGEAFGPGPATGALPNQMPVSGYRGERLVNTFFHGDDSQGTLTSPEFKIQRKRINFLIGGGKWPGEACINLVVAGKVVRTATGPNDRPGGSEMLVPESWEVAEFSGKQATFEIIDHRNGSWGHINVDQIVQSDDLPRAPDEREERDSLLARANKSVQVAAERVKDDPRRPIYHLVAPANWLNDPNGPLEFSGAYHLFYQNNPYGDGWGNMHWGHWRSRDLVRWEHLPIALWPSRSKGEEHVFSGSAIVRRDGVPMLFYTSIGNRAPEQWAAVPEDPDLVTWKKLSANPVLTESVHNGTKVNEWRDPYLFRDGEQTFMVCGGNSDCCKSGQASVQLYQAENEELTKWKFRGPLFVHPDNAVKNIECPLFFKLGDKWVLIVSQGRPVHWFVGTFDAGAGTFTAETRGDIDVGSVYAPSVMQLNNGRRILWGWVQDFPGSQGWNGCMTLPRELSISDQGTLVQKPVAELEKLRDTEGKTTRNGEYAIVFDSSAIAAGKPAEVRFSGLQLDGAELAIGYDGSYLNVGATKLPLPQSAAEKELPITAFLDGTVLEVYTPAGVVTRVVEAPNPSSDLKPSFTRCELRHSWPIQSIWQ